MWKQKYPEQHLPHNYFPKLIQFHLTVITDNNFSDRY